MPSKIEWCDDTWNPIVGCSKVSPGCQNCYAERMAKRLACIDQTQGVYDQVIDHGHARGASHWNGRTVLAESQLFKPLKRKKPTLYFVCSMGDLFHETVPDEWLDQMFVTMNVCYHHRFMILTKRPERMLQYMSQIEPWLKNVAIGVTAENQDQADKRRPILLQTPACHRFVSVEPMLGSVDLDRGGFSFLRDITSPTGKKYNGLDLVICGGESGPGARPMHPDWVRGLRDQCAAAGVPFMFKQWGDYVRQCDVWADWTKVYTDAGLQPESRKGGRLIDGAEHNGTINWEVE